MGCKMGEFMLCGDAECAEPAPGMCINANSAVEEVEVVQSAMTISSLPTEAIEALKGDEDKAKEVFAEAIKASLDTDAEVTVTAVIFPDRRLRSIRAISLVGRLLQAGVIVEFYVESTDSSITDALTKLADGDADTSASFMSEISTELVEGFP